MENLLEILLIASFVIFGLLLFMYIRKINRDINELDKRKRKRDKNILKLMSNKKNKTY